MWHTEGTQCAPLFPFFFFLPKWQNDKGRRSCKTDSLVFIQDRQENPPDFCWLFYRHGVIKLIKSTRDLVEKVISWNTQKYEVGSSQLMSEVPFYTCGSGWCQENHEEMLVVDVDLRQTPETVMDMMILCLRTCQFHFREKWVSWPFSYRRTGSLTLDKNLYGWFRKSRHKLECSCHFVLITHFQGNNHWLVFLRNVRIKFWGGGEGG